MSIKKCILILAAVAAVGLVSCGNNNAGIAQTGEVFYWDDVERANEPFEGIHAADVARYRSFTKEKGNFVEIKNCSIPATIMEDWDLRTGKKCWVLEVYNPEKGYTAIVKLREEAIYYFDSEHSDFKKGVFQRYGSDEE